MWYDTLPDRNIWNYLVNADQENADQEKIDQENADQENIDQENADHVNRDQAAWNQELVESSGYEGMHAMYWNSRWQETEPDYATPYLGIIYRGVVDDMRRTDILIMRYGEGGDKGKVLYRLQTEEYVGNID